MTGPRIPRSLLLIGITAVLFGCPGDEEEEEGDASQGSGMDVEVDGPGDDAPRDDGMTSCPSASCPDATTDDTSAAPEQQEPGTDEPGIDEPGTDEPGMDEPEPPTGPCDAGECDASAPNEGEEHPVTGCEQGCDNFLFCDGVETCDEAAGICKDGDDPCTDLERPYCIDFSTAFAPPITLKVGCTDCIEDGHCAGGEYCFGSTSKLSPGPNPACKPCPAQDCELCGEDEQCCEFGNGCTECITAGSACPKH